MATRAHSTTARSKRPTLRPEAVGHKSVIVDIAAASCPAAAIGRRIEEGVKVIDALEIRNDEHGALRERQMIDYLEQQARQLEWVQAVSVEGVHAQVLQLIDLVRQFGDDGIQQDRRARRAERLGQAILSALQEIGRLGPTAGGANYICRIDKGLREARDGHLIALAESPAYPNG